MADDPPLLHIQQQAVSAVSLICLPVGHLVDAVNKAVVNVIGFQGVQLPVDAALDGLRIGGPAVGAGEVIGAKVDLLQHLFPHGA